MEYGIYKFRNQFVDFFLFLLTKLTHCLTQFLRFFTFEMSLH